MVKRGLLLFLLAAAVGITNCATKVAGLKQSPSFVYPNIVQGKIAVGGVTSVMDVLEDSRRNAMANLLRTELLEERKDYNVTPAGALANKLGKNKYNQLLEAYQSEGVLADNWLKSLRESAPGHRYVAFARIENDSVVNDRNDTSDRNDKGEVIPNTERVVTTTKRTVTASLNIYDLQTGEVAWSGSVTKTLANSNEFARTKELGVVSIIKAFKGTGEASEAEKYPFPAPPDTSKVLAKVFAGFAENLPKKP